MVQLMFIKKNSIFLIFFIFLSHLGFTEELITKHKIEFTKYRYYQDYEILMVKIIFKIT